MKNFACSLSFVFALLIVFISAPARADETVPGSACTVAGQVNTTGGPEQIPARTLICDGTVWKILKEVTVTGRSLTQVGNDTGSCTADKVGRMRYNETTDIWEYCDGSDPWLPFKKPLCQNDDTGECLLPAVRNSADADFIASNIASGVNILGVVGTRVGGAAATVTKLSSDGPISTCFITSAGRAYCWGEYQCLNGNGNCTNNWGINRATLNYGGGDSWDSLTAAQEVFGGHTNWTHIVSGHNHSCGIRAGALYCWGENADGQLGTGNSTDQIAPIAVSGGFTDWTYVTTGGLNDYQPNTASGRTCGIRNSNRLYCWGNNTSGVLGIGNSLSQNTPQQVTATADWAQVSGGAWHSCAVKTSGRLFCWGWGDNGALGSGYTTRNTPREATGATTDWVQVAAGAQHSCAVKTTGQLFCWGWNGNGELGTGNTTQAGTPQQVSGAATDWRYVATGMRTTCAIKTNGRLYCWGFGAGGERGDGAQTNTQSTPVEVSGGYTDWVTVSLAGGSSSYPNSSTVSDTWGRACGLRGNGRVYCWGDSDSGVIGDGMFREAAKDNFQLTPKAILQDISD